MIKVYHTKNYREYLRHGAPAQHEYVASVDTDSLDEAFQLTNSIEDSWVKNPEVTTDLEEARSTSAGDMMERDGKRFIVSNFGFEEVTGA